VRAVYSFPSLFSSPRLVDLERGGSGGGVMGGREGGRGGKLRTDLARNSRVFLEGRKEEKGKQGEEEEKGQGGGGLRFA